MQKSIKSPEEHVCVCVCVAVAGRLLEVRGQLTVAALGSAPVLGPLVRDGDTQRRKRPLLDTLLIWNVAPRHATPRLAPV